MITFLISFFAGMLSVLAPCVLPLLPIIIGGSVAAPENKLRPYIIIASLITSLIAFTLLLKVSTALLGWDPRIWTYISGFMVIFLGLSLLFPSQWTKIAMKIGFSDKSHKLLDEADKKESSVASAVLTGVALGPVFTSCSPMYAWILASVLPADKVAGLAYLFAYSLGLGLTLLAIALFGQRIVSKFKVLANPNGWFQRGLAILFILVGLAIITGVEKDIRTYLTENDFLNLKTLESDIKDKADS